VKKVVVKILQGSVVAQTMLCGLSIYPQVANFLKCICATNYANWLAGDKVIPKISRLTFLAHPVLFLLMLWYYVKPGSNSLAKFTFRLEKKIRIFLIHIS